jgi:hypothetical protein
MIKENDNYIAVKVETRENYEIGYVPKDNIPYVYWNSGQVYLYGYYNTELEIVGLISEGWELQDSDSLYSLACLAGEIDPKEWNQWLIIKKNG